MQKTCIIIPCYNEEKRLDVPSFTNFIERNNYDFCFVNDGSKDGTQRILTELQTKFPKKIYVLRLEQNEGKAAAVRKGFLKVLDTKIYEIIGYMDADLATPLEEASYLLSHLKGKYDMVIGARVKRLGTNIHRNLSRHYLGRIFATFSSFILKIKVYDSQCGAKFFKTGIAEKLFAEKFNSVWLFDLELIYRLKEIEKENFNDHILEIPLRKWEEKHNSKMNFMDFLLAPIDVLKIKYRN